MKIRWGLLAKVLPLPEDQFGERQSPSVLVRTNFCGTAAHISGKAVLRDLSCTFFDKDLELPIECSDLPLDRGWDCERMVVRAVAGKDQHYSHTLSGPPISNGKIVQAAKASTNNDSRTSIISR